MLTVGINSPDYQLDLKLVLKGGDRRGHKDSVGKGNNYQYKDRKVRKISQTTS